MELKKKHTRLRAYQLRSKGSSFSYWDGTNLTLCEARYNDDNKASIWHEIKRCGQNKIDFLHITSWDADHCSSSELEAILKELKPREVEIPGYEIDKNIQNQVDCLKLIEAYKLQSTGETAAPKVIKVDKTFVTDLGNATEWAYESIHYNNRKDYSKSNNNSTVKLFKNGSFSLLSLGDLEEEEISNWLIQFSTIKNEVDVMILAHHGSDNGFTSEKFLDAVKPSVGLSLCDWGNQHDHPSRTTIKKLEDRKIYNCTTKNGDVIIESIDDHTGDFKVWDFMAGGKELKEAPRQFTSKRKLANK
ncbi:MAG: hypothetical protein J0L69_15420 [Bacteroidetes bacterium]|nr:hypothetical protein [Bacteroidota bacterium]